MIDYDISGGRDGFFIDGVTNFSSEAFFNALLSFPLTVACANRLNLVRHIHMDLVVFKRIADHNLVGMDALHEHIKYMGIRVRIADGTRGPGVFETLLVPAGGSLDTVCLLTREY